MATLLIVFAGSIFFPT